MSAEFVEFDLVGGGDIDVVGVVGEEVAGVVAGDDGEPGEDEVLEHGGGTGSGAVLPVG